jgi:hypothetical protein
MTSDLPAKFPRQLLELENWQRRARCPILGLLMTQSGHPGDLQTVGLAGLIPAIQITLIS